jgi:hypothetical protein
MVKKMKQCYKKIIVSWKKLLCAGLITKRKAD